MNDKLKAFTIAEGLVKKGGLINPSTVAVSTRPPAPPGCRLTKTIQDANVISLPGIYIALDAKESDRKIPQEVLRDPSVHTIISHSPPTKNRPKSVITIKKHFDIQDREVMDINTWTLKTVKTDIIDYTFDYRGHSSTTQMVIPMEDFPLED